MRAGRKRLRTRGSFGDQRMGNRPSNQPQALLELGCGAGREGVFNQLCFDVDRNFLSCPATGTAKIQGRRFSRVDPLRVMIDEG